MATTRDLDSASACAIARIEFVNAEDYDFPVVTFRTKDALSCAIKLKTSVLGVSGQLPRSTEHRREVLRPPSNAIALEHQALHAIPAKSPGVLHLLEGAASVLGKSEWPVSILALTLPKDNHVRWYWTTSNISVVLLRLNEKWLISPPRVVERGNPSHKRLFTTLKMLFEHFKYIPDSPDFKRAEQMTDYCPDIEDPETACHRLEVHPYLYHSFKGTYRDMSDDRYLLKLDPAERQVASMMDITAAKYLLMKREYFKEFMKELRHNRHKIPVPSRAATRRPATQSRRNVETDADDIPDLKDEESRSSTPKPLASKSSKKKQKSSLIRRSDRHIYKLRATYDWPYSKARTLVEAWTELGFLNEESFVDWIDYGGMFETIGLEA